MNIGLVGYFGEGNYGDELFLEVLRSLFPADRLTVLPDFRQEPYYDAARIAAQDCVIIGGGDLVLPRGFANHYWEQALLSKPVFICGVGVPTWTGTSPDAVQKMKAFFQHENVRLVTARDPKSRDWIATHLQPTAPVESYPDMVAALQFQRQPHAGRRLGLVLRAHQPDFSANLRTFVDRAVTLGYDVHNIILGVGRTADDDRAAVGSLDLPFTSVIERNSIGGVTDELLRCDVVASQKFHGCVVAMMAGIPTISLSMSDKFVSWFEFFRKELFLLGNAGDPGLAHRLIEPMYAIGDGDIARIRSQAREGLLRLRREVLALAAP